MEIKILNPRVNLLVGGEADLQIGFTFYTSSPFSAFWPTYVYAYKYIIKL